MAKKLYEFKKELMSHKIGEITSLTEEEAILLKDYVIEHFSKEQRLKNLKEASINHLKKLIWYLENNKYDLAFEMIKEHDAYDSTVEYIDFTDILQKSMGFKWEGSIGDVIRLLVGGV